MHRTTTCILLLLAAAAAAAEPCPLRDAVECTPRGGLPNVFAALKAGKETTIAYLGGSITAQKGWRPLTLDWFRTQYPDAKIDEINAAIGGTGSDLGVFRLDHDVLRHEPDLLFVEFAVNDGGAPPARIHKAMEGIVRKTWKADPATDICFVYTLAGNMINNLRDGKYPRAASAMEALADHYGIPSIHMGLAVARMEQRGELAFKVPRDKKGKDGKTPDGKIAFSPDAVHPYTDTGHRLYLDAVVRSMKPIAAAGAPGPHAVGAPLVADNWERATLVPLDRVALSGAWKKLDPASHPLARRFARRLPGLWKAEKPGATISFRFTGTRAGIYDLLGPDCGQVIVRLDDRKPKTRRRIDGYCSYHRLATLVIAAGLEDTVHRVTLEIHPEQPDKEKILQSHRLPDFRKNPKKYDGTAWYAGAVMLIGDIVEE